MVTFADLSYRGKSDCFHRSRASLRRPNEDPCIGCNARSTLRLMACRVAMRANSMGPPCSAALIRSSAAVRTAGMLRSDAGMVFTRCSDCLAQGRQLGAVGQHDRLGKTTVPGHDATRDRTAIQAGGALVVPRGWTGRSRCHGRYKIAHCGPLNFGLRSNRITNRSPHQSCTAWPTTSCLAFSVASVSSAQISGWK